MKEISRELMGDKDDIALYCVLDISPLLDSDFRHKCPILDTFV